MLTYALQQGLPVTFLTSFLRSDRRFLFSIAKCCFLLFVFLKGWIVTQTLGLLEVYQAGELTVVGFGGREILEQVSLIEYRDELQALTDEVGCETLAIDLTGVRIVPSGMLGILASLHSKGIQIQLFNAGEEIREVLEITKLDQLFNLHEVEV